MADDLGDGWPFADSASHTWMSTETNFEWRVAFDPIVDDRMQSQYINRTDLTGF